MPAPALQRLFFSAIIVTACVATLPVALAAQSADTTGFRAGQWGAEVGLDAGFSNLGVLRFSAPGRAWLGVLGARDERISIENEMPDGSSEVARSWETSELVLRLGHRWYRSIASSVQQHVTVGGLIGGRRRDTEGPFSTGPERSFGVGVVADIGAIWMVTRRLSLGAAWNADAIRYRATGGASPAQEYTRSGVELSFGRVDLRAALYF